MRQEWRRHIAGWQALEDVEATAARQSAAARALNEAVGEIYVLGIDPDAQGIRLGTALTDLGLAHLRGRGLREVLLYVEEDNTAAVRLYEGRGFRRYAVDVAWHRAAPSTRS